MQESTPENKNFHNFEPELIDHTVQISNPVQLTSDPSYPILLEYYQNAEFTACLSLAEQLEKRYPGHPWLQKLIENLQIKISLRDMEDIKKREEKRTKKIATLKLILFAIIGLFIVLTTFFFSYNYLNSLLKVRQLEKESAQVSSLSYQVEQLLLVGQPRPAAEIIEKIRTINPAYAPLPELIARTEILLAFESNYQAALDLIAEGKNNQALVLLHEIETALPGMWDVPQLISTLESTNSIPGYLTKGTYAFNGENWDLAILDIRDNDGIILAFFAINKRSPVNAIIEAINLPMSVSMTIGRDLKGPIINQENLFS